MPVFVRWYCSIGHPYHTKAMWLTTIEKLCLLTMTVERSWPRFVRRDRRSNSHEQGRIHQQSFRPRDTDDQPLMHWRWQNHHTLRLLTRIYRIAGNFQGANSRGFGKIPILGRKLSRMTVYTIVTLVSKAGSKCGHVTGGSQEPKSYFDGVLLSGLFLSLSRICFTS